MGWTSDRVEKLRKLHAEGLTCQQIADRLGGVSRSGVIGKLHRLGISGAEKPRRPAGDRLEVKRPRAPRPLRVIPKSTTHKQRVAAALQASAILPKIVDVEVPPDRRKTIVDLEENDCRWPIGDPQHADFHFCDRTKVLGLPYCEAHARRAYEVGRCVEKNPVDAEKVAAPKQLEDA